MSRPVRVFLGLTEVAGYFAGLREGLECLGVEVFQVDDSLDPFAYMRTSRGTTIIGVARRLRAMETGLASSHGTRSRSGRLALRVARLPTRLLLLSSAMMWALAKSKEYHASLFGSEKKW